MSSLPSRRPSVAMALKTVPRLRRTGLKAISRRPSTMPRAPPMMPRPRSKRSLATKPSFLNFNFPLSFDINKLLIWLSLSDVPWGGGSTILLVLLSYYHTVYCIFASQTYACPSPHFRAESTSALKEKRIGQKGKQQVGQGKKGSQPLERGRE